MGYKLVILPRAQQELIDAFDYYNKISVTVLKAFNSDLEDVYQSLEKNPFYQLKYKNLRGVPFKKFPFLMFFSIEEIEKIVYIYSVFHTSQNPETYPNR